MSITSTLDDKLPNLIVVTFIGNWTWADYRQSINQTLLLASTLTGRIDEILDFRQTQHIPEGWAEIEIARGKTVPVDVTMTILVSNEAYVKNLYEAIDRNYENIEHLVATLEEARAIIREDRA